jgi:hypothetical protein
LLPVGRPRFRGDALPVVSIYLGIAVGSGARRAIRTSADSLLHGIRSLANDSSLGHAARLSLREDIESIERLARAEQIGRGTLAFFYFGLVRAGRFDVLSVGGHEHELPLFMEFPPRRLRERVAGTFSIDAHTATAATVRPGAEAILERYELDEGGSPVRCERWCYFDETYI